MKFKQIVAIAGIYLLACMGWSILGSTTMVRSYDYSSKLRYAVSSLWGSRLIQTAPEFLIKMPGTNEYHDLLPTRQNIKVDLKLEHRKKGLIWYPTYHTTFSGAYQITNHQPIEQKIRIHFEFPDKKATYDKIVFSMDQMILMQAYNTVDGINEIIELSPGESRTFNIAYSTRGMYAWRYQLAPNTGRIRQLDLVVNTDFDEIDFPDGAMSPMTTKYNDQGMTLTWQAEDLLTMRDVGIIMPEKINPGPLVSRITFFAPVCLLFFFVLLAAINIVYKQNMHPMHYLFVASGFFAFHLLFAYLVDVINVHLAFLISSLVTLPLVNFYLMNAFKPHFPWKLSTAGQSFYLILFSYTFFLKGLTGLVVTIGSIITLAVLMKVTIHTDWHKVFARKEKVAEVNS